MSTVSLKQQYEVTKRVKHLYMYVEGIERKYHAIHPMSRFICTTNMNIIAS